MAHITGIRVSGQNSISWGGHLVFINSINACFFPCILLSCLSELFAYETPFVGT